MATWAFAAASNVYYRPPAGSRPTLIRTDRPNRPTRYHLGARLGDGPLLMPEACNLESALSLTDLGNVPLPTGAMTSGAACRRCFPP